MEETKESPLVNHFKLWLFVIAVSLIFIYGRVTAHAEDSIETQLNNADFEYAIFLNKDSGVGYIKVWKGEFKPDSKSYAGEGFFCDMTYSFKYASGSGASDFENFTDCYNTIVDNYATCNYTPYGISTELAEGYEWTYASCDLIDKDGNVFFWLQPWVMVHLVTPIQTVAPATTKIMKIILPIAVFCLALLMGLVILRKKLPVFLR